MDEPWRPEGGPDMKQYRQNSVPECENTADASAVFVDIRIALSLPITT